MSDREKKRGIPYDRRILLTGDTGFFGKNLVSVLKTFYKDLDLIELQGRKFFDLTRPNHVETVFKTIKLEGYVDTVIHLAAYSGGMFENMEHPAEFWYQNTMLITNMLEQCATHKVRKLLIPIGGCAYPDVNDKNGVYAEDDLWEGFPNKNSYGYSMAKKQAVIGGMAYEKQFGLKTIVCIPTNPIGPWDNVDQKRAHVPMALIGRFLEAKREGYENVTIYGSGKPVRDFLYIGDIVKLFPRLIEYYDTSLGPINISSGVGTSIAELAEAIKKAVGFTGNIIYDSSKPDGQMIKILDNSKLVNFCKENDIEWKPLGLEETISITVEWYRKRILGE